MAAIRCPDRDIVVQFEVAPAKGLKSDPVSCLNVPVCGQVGTPCRERPHQLHPGHDAQLLTHAFGSRQDGIVDHLHGDAPCGQPPSSGRQGARVAPQSCRRGWGRDGALAGEGGMCGVCASTSSFLRVYGGPACPGCNFEHLYVRLAAGTAKRPVLPVDSTPTRCRSPKDRIQASICRWPWRVVANERVPRTRS